jgi:hypothetical protein
MRYSVLDDWTKGAGVAHINEEIGEDPVYNYDDPESWDSQFKAGERFWVYMDLMAPNRMALGQSAESGSVTRLTGTIYGLFENSELVKRYAVGQSGEASQISGKAEEE